MKGIAKFDQSQLDALIADARKEAGAEGFAPQYLQAVRVGILGDPLLYRSYGPYWWLLKRELLAAGTSDFGESFDTETAEALDYGNQEQNLAACYSYQSLGFDQMTTYSHHHAVELSDGVAEVFVLVDEEVELIAVARLAQAGMAKVH